MTRKIKHAIKSKTSPARLAQLLQPSLAFCFSLQPMTAGRDGMFCFTCNCSLIAIDFHQGASAPPNSPFAFASRHFLNSRPFTRSLKLSLCRSIAYQISTDSLRSGHAQEQGFHIGVGDGGQGGGARAPLKFGKKYFSGNYYVKFGHFSGKNHVKLGNLVKFSGKHHKNSGILIIFRARIM